MDALVAEYLAEQQEFAALTSLLSEARVVAARPFDARVEMRITVAGLEQSLLCNEEVLSMSVFPVQEEEGEGDGDEETAPTTAAGSEDASNSETSKDSAVHGDAAEASSSSPAAEEEGEKEGEKGEEEEEENAAAPADTAPANTEEKEEEEDEESTGGADGEDEAVRLRCVRDIWDSTLVRLDDLAGVRAPDSSLRLALRLALLFVEVRQAFGDAAHLSPAEARQLTALVARIFGAGAIAPTGHDGLDRALRTLQRGRPARRRDAAYRALVAFGVQFSCARLVAMLKRYFCELRAALGPSTLSRVATDLARGVYAPGKPPAPAAAAAPDPAAVAEARASLGQVRQSLEACRRSLARIVQDPLPAALGAAPSKEQQGEQQQQPQGETAPRPSSSSSSSSSKKRGHKRRRSSDSVSRRSSSSNGSSGSSSGNKDKPEQQQQQQQQQEQPQKTLATVSPEPPAGVQGSVLQPDQDLLDLLNRGEPVAKVRRLKRPFSAEEEANLREGVRRYGVGNWRLILMGYSFANRTAVDLKDKWRNIQKMERRAQKRAIEDIAANGLPDAPGE